MLNSLPEALAEDPDLKKPAPIAPFFLFGESTQAEAEARVTQESYKRD